MTEPTKDVLVECPYDKCHRILKSRLQTHVVKCAAAHIMEKMKVCPFNATHRVKEPLYQHHVATCDDRRILELSKYCVGGGDGMPQGRPAVAPYTAPILPPDDENWDSMDAPTYDPGLVTQGKEVIRSLRMMGMGEQQSKSKRKAFRREERLRISNLQEGITPAVESVSLPPSKPRPVHPDINTPLRQPRQASYMGPINPSLGLGRGSVKGAGKSPRQQPDKPDKRPEGNMFRLAASFQQMTVGGRGTSVNSPNPPPGLEPVTVGRGVAIPYAGILRQPHGLRPE